MEVPTFAVVGRVNRGKSSIIATLAEEDSIAISPLPGTTRTCTSYEVELDGQVLFRLIDTPGFEDAARALSWLQASKPSPDQRRARVAEFRQTFAGTEEFVEECELLGPVLDGAAILYVVDGSTPFRENVMAEVEILRWTGQPRMALVNRTLDATHLPSWHAALAPAFSTVRNFDAHAASFRERLQLLSLFRELVEPWREPLGRAVERLVAEQSRRLGESALAIAGMLIDACSHTVVIEAGEAGLSAEEQRAVEQRFLDELRGIEERARRHVEQLYRHRSLSTRSEELERPVFSRDLFSKRVWSSLGLSAGQLVAAYSVAGATAGGTLDAMVGGASFFAGTALGAALGGAAALYQLGARAFDITAVQGWGERLEKAKAPTRRFRIGPHQHPNFPFVLLDRALMHHQAIRCRAHALNTSADLDLERVQKSRELPASARQRLARCFARARKLRGSEDPALRRELANLVEALLRDGDSGAA